MPIKREDFELGLAGIIKNVYEFLLNNPEKAFNSGELAENFDVNHSEMIDILNYLFNRRRMISRQVILGSYYYASKKEET